MATSPYVVPVARLLRGDQPRVAVNFSAPFDENGEFEPRGFAESDVPQGAEAVVEVVLSAYNGGVRVRGAVGAPWHGICRRCSKEVAGSLQVAIDERYVEGDVPEDEEAYGYKGDQIDLAPMVHDAVFLELPIAPLCRPECQGLCPICGIDRNEATCECRPDGDPRWATLDALRFEDPESD